jgi:hypothetical protein
MPRIEKLNEVPFDIQASSHIIFSVDPGKENFACRLEKRENGVITPLMFIRIKLTDHVLQEIKQFLDDKADLLRTSTVMIVERQMPINYRMVRLSQFIETYFICMYPNVSLFEISSKLKADKKICVATCHSILEKGGDSQSIELLHQLKKDKVKIDDLADTVCQIQAFFDVYPTEKKIPLGPSAFFNKPKKSRAKKTKVTKATTDVLPKATDVLPNDSTSKVKKTRKVKS